jgi:hypothetical protein
MLILAWCIAQTEIPLVLRYRVLVRWDFLTIEIGKHRRHNFDEICERSVAVAL